MDTLYIALEGALTMIHPFMPFLTEELWQRLPRRPGDTTPSIMKALYPQYDVELDDAASEVAYELILGFSKAIRSLLAEYAIKDRATGLCRSALQRVEMLMGFMQRLFKHPMTKVTRSYSVKSHPSSPSPVKPTSPSAFSLTMKRRPRAAPCLLSPPKLPSSWRSRVAS